jgi:hypothetical protein
MGIDYVVDLDCPAKQALTLEKMVSLIKGRNQASVIIEMSRSKGDQRPPEQLTFTRMVLRPEGPTKQEINVGTLLKQTQELEVHAHHCEGCKANLLEHPYGCYGSISYPISARAEEWLMSLLPAKLESAAGYMLRSAVTDFKYNGDMFLGMRPKDMFFESRTPVKRTWAGWTLTSDQVLQMLFGLGNLQPSHCQMICIILGTIPTDEAAAPPPPPSPNDQTGQFADALNAVGLAAKLGVYLVVDA